MGQCSFNCVHVVKLRQATSLPHFERANILLEFHLKFT